MDATTAGRALLVFADDWGRHPSSCQHIVGELLSRHPILWVNTVGTRAPAVDLATLRRGAGKLRQWLRPGRGAHPDAGRPANPRVLNPKMWPAFRPAAARRLNRALLLRQLQGPVAEAAAPPVAVTTLPITADLIGRLPVERWVYYCVDDFGAWPGLDQRTLAAMEADLVRRADVLIAAGENLRCRLAAMGREAHVLTHGVDLEFWSRPGAKPPAGVAGLEPPRVVFWGVIDGRLDVRFLEALDRSLSRGTVILAGPEDQPAPDLSGLKSAVKLGPLPFASLPGLAAAADVLIMPYADLPVTRAMQPLKLKEYLATGKPAVVRDLPGTRDWADCADLVSDPEEFAAAVLRAARDGTPPAQREARHRLAAEGWSGKAELFRTYAGIAG